MWTDYAVATFDQLHSEGADQPKMMSLGLHLRIIGRPGRIGALRKFMAYVKQQPAVWVASRGQIADHFARVSPFQA
jgi:peptidoglycan/xylan/chitin deacetylase (PgdA/CDA1 family)